MTSAEHRYFTKIKEFIDKNGYAPSYEEIAKLVGVGAIASVHRIVVKLIRDGHLLRNESKGSSRNLSIAPTKEFDGLDECHRAHPRIWFQGECPMCKMMSIIGQQRTVTSEDKPLNGYLTRQGLSTAAATVDGKGRE